MEQTPPRDGPRHRLASSLVRAGDVATIPVLDNDYSPNGDTITLAPALIAPLIDPADGDMFVAQNTLRFKAGPVAKTVYATYEVVDSQGQRDAGYVTIQIVGNHGKLEDFLRVLEPYGVRELVQSGVVAIGRGSRSISERTLRPVAVPAPTAAG